MIAEHRVLVRTTMPGELVQAVQAWLGVNGIELASVDRLAGYADRYTQKILTGRKPFLARNAAELLQACGLMLWIAVDEPQWHRMRSRLAPNRWPEKRATSAKQRARQKLGNPSRSQFKGNSVHMRNLALIAATKTTTAMMRRQRRRAGMASAAKRKLRARINQLIP